MRVGAPARDAGHRATLGPPGNAASHFRALAPTKGLLSSAPRVTTMGPERSSRERHPRGDQRQLNRDALTSRSRICVANQQTAGAPTPPLTACPAPRTPAGFPIDSGLPFSVKFSWVFPMPPGAAQGHPLTFHRIPRASLGLCFPNIAYHLPRDSPARSGGDGWAPKHYLRTQP